MHLTFLLVKVNLYVICIPEMMDLTANCIPTPLGHTKLIFCFSDSAGLFLADLKTIKILINIPHIMVVTGQEYSLERALLV